jgi:hypothetical protein
MKLFTEEQLKRLPKLYSQDGLGDNAKVKLVVILGKFVWLLTEYDNQDLFFGFVYLNDAQNAELGYVSKSELEDLMKEYNVEIIEVDINLKEAKEILFNKEKA